MTVMSFDFSQITGYNRQILEGLKNSPKEFDRFLSSAAGQMRTFAKKTTRSATKKKTGNLLAGIDKGKPYEFQPGDHPSCVVGRTWSPYRHWQDRHRQESGRPSSDGAGGHRVRRMVRRPGG